MLLEGYCNDSFGSIAGVLMTSFGQSFERDFMKRCVVVLALLITSLAFAEPNTLTAKDIGLVVHFDAPRTEKIHEESTPAAYLYVGSKGNFTVSLSIQSPSCEGGTAREDHLRCFIRLISMLPGINRDSIQVNRLPGSIRVSYLTETRRDEGTNNLAHTHILFADGDKWADLHGSILHPSSEEITMLSALGDSFRFNHVQIRN